MLKFLSILSNLLDWLFPRRCYCCKKTSETSVCKDCLSSIKILEPTPIKIINHTKIYSSTVYSKVTKKLIRAIKYHQKQEFSNELANIMFKFWQNINIKDKKDFYEIVPTPSFEERLKQRKYDHIKLICDDFAKITNYKINTSLLKRIKNTKPQYKLTRKQREENLKNAFICNKSKYTGSPILIIDDICTTGTTLSEIIKTLHTEGIMDITALCCSCNKSYIQDDDLSP